MNAVSQYVLILGLQASLMSAIAYTAMLAFRKSSVTVHAIGIECTLLLLASPILVAILPFNGIIASFFIERPVEIAEPIRVEAPVATQTPLSQSAPAMESISLPSDSIRYATDLDLPLPAQSFAQPEPRQTQIATDNQTEKFLSIKDIPLALGLLWFMGAACLAVLRIRGYLRLRSVVRKARHVELDSHLINHLSRVFGRKTHANVLALDSLSVPFVLGFLKPRIIVPSYVWESSTLRQDVVTHELAHVIRHDHWFHLAQRVVSILYWWQPLVHANNCKISSARETIADNYVLRGSDSSSYADTLLAVAEHCIGVRSPRNALAFLARPTTLEKRVAAILDEARQLHVTPSVSTRLAIIMFVLFMACLGGGLGTYPFNALAQEVNANQPSTSNTPASSNETAVTNESRPEFGSPSNDKVAHSVSGRILDTKGNPVADCLLVVRAYSREGSDVIQSVHSDSQGNYAMDLPPIYHLGSHQGWAYKDGYNMRTVFFASLLWKKVSTGLDIVLLDQETTEITILSPDGNPAPDVVVKPYTYWVPMSHFSEIPKDLYHSPTPIPEEIATRIQTVTNAQGKAKVVGLSPKLVFGFHAVTKDYGEQEFNLDFLPKLDQPEPFFLSSTRVVRGVLHANNPERFKGKFIELRSLGGAISPNPPSPDRLQRRRGPRMSGSGYAKVEVDANGEFEVPTMAIGEVTPSFKLWSLDNDVVPVLDTKQPQFPNRKNLQEELKLEFSLMRTVQVQGRLLKADTKEPIPDACVCFYNRSLAIAAQCCTDNQGRFSVNVPSGASEGQAFHLVSILENYDLPRDFTINVDPSEDTMQVDDLLADPWPHWVIHLNAADGSPITNHHMALTYQRTDQPRSIYLRGKSDASGIAPMRLSSNAMPSIDKGDFTFYLTQSVDASEVDPNGSLVVDRRTDNEIWLIPKGTK